MLRHVALICALIPAAAIAQNRQPVINGIIDGLILPRYVELEDTAAQLDETAHNSCNPQDAALRSAFHDTVDAWMPVAHFRFGPSEDEDRAFAMAFWPDTKGFTDKALRGLILDADPIIDTDEGFAQTSIAGRGLFAMERLLYDAALSQIGTEAYRCALIRAVASDILRIASGISNDWDGFQLALAFPKSDGPYRDQSEVLRVLLNALTTGLEFNGDMRLGRPMGSFERPRPTRAEMWRSARSLQNVQLSMHALHELGFALAAGDAELQAALQHVFDRITAAAADIDDPAFAGVSDVMGRLRVEILQQAITAYRDLVALELAPHLGVAPGFNALDGD